MRRTSEEVPQAQHNEDRMRRARSWLKRSELAEANRKQSVSAEDKATLDCEQFIFLWISFNAAYGRKLDDENTAEREKFNEFLAKILKRDSTQAIKTILKETYSGPVHNLLKNQYVFRPFWQWVRGSDKDSNWETRLKRKNDKVFSALLNRDDIGEVLKEVFDRLYELRNQLIHGGATCATGWGKSQVRDGSRIMASLVPEIIRIMQTDIEKNPDSDTWGKVAYPRVNEAPDAGMR